MFTGIVQERGRVVEGPGDSRGRDAGHGARVVVGHSAELASRLGSGASLSVSGVCLTVVEQGVSEQIVSDRPGRRSLPCPRPDPPEASATGRDTAHGVPAAGAACPPAAWSAFDLSPETLSRTTLSTLRAGGEVNLEPPLAAGDPLGGHWVQGHVDATARVANVEALGENRVITFEIPAELETGLVFKGSVTIDGVSLTVAALNEGTFDVALIPHTLEVTTLSDLKPDDRVNVEGDIIARYLQKSVEAAVAAALESAGRR